MAAVVHFVRHGEVHNPSSVYYGRLPGFHLSSRGFAQATEAAAALAVAAQSAAARLDGTPQLGAVRHSPLLRARETAEVLLSTAQHEKGQLLEATLHEESLLLEVYTPFDGTPISEMEAIGWQLYSHGREADGYEVFTDVLDRVKTVLDAALTGGPDGVERHIACVCHGDLCLVARLWGTSSIGEAKIRSAEFSRDDVPYPDHCSITSLLVTRDDVTGVLSVQWLPQDSEELAASVQA